MCETGHTGSREGQDGFGNTFPDRIQQMLHSLRTREPWGELYACCEETLLENLSSLYLLTRERFISLHSGHFRTSHPLCLCKDQLAYIFQFGYQQLGT